MKPLRRMRYHTMNSWNNSMAPAYNLKVYNVINKSLQNKVYELLACDELWFEIDELIRDFNVNSEYKWQAGFNGRSGGYLVLYEGGRQLTRKSTCINCNQVKFTSIKDTGNICDKCNKPTRIDEDTYQVFTYLGKSIEYRDVPNHVLKDFEQLAINIVKTTESLAKQYNIVEEKYQVPKIRKVLEPIK